MSCTGFAISKSKARTVFSKLSRKSQTILPREVRERLRVGPGDRVCHVLAADGVRIEKESQREEDELLAAFSEWASEADEEAYGDL